MAVRKTAKGAALKRWFEEKWTDQHGRECGSPKTKGIKKCRPSKKISGKTPKTWSQVDKNKEVAKKRRVGMGNRTSKAKHGGEACFTNTGVRIPGMIKKK
jgi:hypothetical protein